MNARQLLADVRDYCREPYAWPGGYPKVLIMSDGECLCSKCARSEYRAISAATRAGLRDGWRAEGVDIHWEGPAETCAHCNAEIESAYGDPDADACPECARSNGPHYRGPCEH